MKGGKEVPKGNPLDEIKRIEKALQLGTWEKEFLQKEEEIDNIYKQ